jgi:spermidine synthase
MNFPYLLIPIALTLLILYFISLSLSRLSVIKKTTHRKIWNILLLITFLVTALLGLILAIQVNYKFKIPYLKQILTLHVDFGIGMTMIAVFHFLWHWTYYLNLFKLKKDHQETNTAASMLIDAQTVMNSNTIRKPYRTLALLLGFTSIITQIILLREFMLLFSGNELVIGIILAIWMIITATGAYLGKLTRIHKYSSNFISSAFILLGLIPLITVFVADYLKNTIFQPGIAFGTVKIIYSAAVILLPFCLLSGFLFTHIANVYSAATNKKQIDKTYAFESIGSVIAGLSFSYLLAGRLSTFQILGILLFVNILAYLLTARMKYLTKTALSVIFIGISILPFVFNIDKITKQFLFINQDLTYLKDTPYGNLAVTTYGDQQNFFENNVLLFTTENVVANEEAVHYAMIQHNNPEDVLLISGGISGITGEILKYDIYRLDYVELNPWLIKLGKEFTTSLESHDINIIQEDARLYIRRATHKYDIIIINLPEPVTAQINRYYTIEFYKDLKEKLKKEGVVTFSLPSSVNYLSDEVIELNSTIYRTIQSVFEHVLIFPGEKNYYVASDSPLEYSISEKFAEKGIDNTYMNSYYLDDNLIRQRADYIISAINTSARINRDFFPVSYFKQIKLWISQFAINKYLRYGGILVLFILLILFIVKASPANLGMFSAGFTASSMEIIILIAFQVIYGYIYLAMGIFFAIFMTGLAMGTLLRERIVQNISSKTILILQFILGLMVFLSVPLLFLMKQYAASYWMVYFISFALLFVIAFLVGAYFSISSVVQSEKTRVIAANVYASDLVGSASGALLSSVILIPQFGLYITIVITGGVSLITMLLIFLKGKLKEA